MQGALPSDTDKNSREHVRVVTLRNEKELEKVDKTRDEPSKSHESVLHNVQFEETSPKVPKNDLSKSKIKGEKKSDRTPSKHSPPLL